MDPNAALAQLRKMVARMNGGGEGEVSEVEASVIAEEMAEHFGALDDWLRTGGFKPKDWE